jgi:two-component system sensor kinase FixL
VRKKIKAPRLPIAKQTLLISLISGLIVATGGIKIWQSVEKNLRSHIVSSTSHTSKSIEIVIREDLKNRTNALERMGHRWSSVNGVTRSDWNADTTSYYDDMPGFQAIEWADASSTIQWVYPLKGNESVQGYDLTRARKVDSEGIAAARELGGSAFTKPFELKQGGLGIVVYVPVSKNNEYDGLILGVFKLDDWIKTIFERLTDSGAYVELRLEGTTIYSNDQSSKMEPNEWTLNQNFDVFGLRWNTIISPPREFISDAYSRVLRIALIGIILLSTLVALLTFFSLAARQRSKEFYNTANQLSVFFQNLPGIAFRCINKSSWPMEFISSGCEELTGFSVGEFLIQGITFGSLIHKDDRERKWLAVQQAVETNGVYEVEYRIETKSNQEKWLWERGQTVPSEAGDVVYIEGVIGDITDRKNVEVEHADLLQFSKAIVETAAEAIITLNTDGRVEGLNDETELIFRGSREELIGRNFDTLVAESYPHKSNLIIDEIKNSDPPLRSLTREISMLKSDNSTLPVLVTISQISIGETKKFVVLIKDLSKQKLAEKESREHLGKLAHIARTNMLGEMTTGIAHEINQPLTAISVFSQAGKRLLESGKIESVSKIFDKLSLHAQRAGEIIERIQALTRQEPSTLVSTNCNTLVTEIATLAEAESHMCDIPIELRLEKDLANVLVDSVQIQQVVLNLLRNAMEAMEAHHCADGNIIEIVTKKLDKTHIEIAVIDSGTGVSKDIEKTVFATFLTTKPSGLGMGLSISRSIIEAHGGSLDFRNNHRCGATFFIVLPTTTEQHQNE